MEMGCRGGGGVLAIGKGVGREYVKDRHMCVSVRVVHLGSSKHSTGHSQARAALYTAHAMQ